MIGPFWEASAEIVVVSLGIFLRVAPNQASHITIKYLDEPTFKKYALTYVIYELNRSQRDWHFTIDFDTF